MKVKRRGLQSKIWQFILIIVLVVATIITVAYFVWLKDYEKEALLHLGYDEPTIVSLREHLPDDDEHSQIELLLTLPYQEALPSLLQHQSFKPENLSTYLDCIADLDHYRLDAVVYLVNNHIDQPYSDLLAALIAQPYFLPQRLERYLAYDPSKPPATVIQEVNCNLDRPYYEDPGLVDTARGDLLLVNKYYKFEPDYKPDDLVEIDDRYDNDTGDLIRPEVNEAFVQMAEAAAKEGLSLRNNSAYRSYTTQQQLYNRYRNNNGINYAEEFAARAGFSEHQAGLALDIGVPVGKVVGDFEQTAEFAWLAQNAWRFGFILRYPKEKEHLTGYHYEPWHYRYVGTEVAEYIYTQKLTFEEYYAVFIESQ